MSETVRTRAEIPAKYKWNAASLFQTEEAWETAADSLLVHLNEIKQLEGSVGRSAITLAEALDASSTLLEKTGIVLTYALNAPIAGLTLNTYSHVLPVLQEEAARSSMRS